MKKAKIIMIITILMFLTNIVTSPLSFSANAESTFNALSFRVNESEQIKYWLFTPSNATDDMPLIVYLHGDSGKGDDINNLKRNGFCKWVSEGQFDNTPAYILFPQIPSSKKGWLEIKTYVKELIEYICEAYHTDKTRISLTGHSKGGSGTWGMAIAYPEMFSAIAPLSGGVQNSAENVNTLANTRIWAFVGSADTIVKPDYSIDFVEALKEKNPNAKITIFDGATHIDVPMLAYLDSDLKLIDWLISAKTDYDFTNREKTTIQLQIGNPVMSVNGEQMDIDESGTTPLIINDRTLVPIRAIIEKMGGTVKWNQDTQAVILLLNGNTIQLVIDSKTAYINGEKKNLDTSPIIFNDRTMLPIRFVAESFGFNVDWEEKDDTIFISNK